MSVDVDALRRTIDLVDFISRYVELRKRGSEYVGLCPFHDDHNPSLAINPAKQVWSCFSCGAHEDGADVIGFLMRYENCTFPEALERLSNGHAVPEAKPIARKLERPPPRELLVPPHGSVPEMARRDLGVPVKVWMICTPEGAPWFYEARYILDGAKETRFWSYGRYSEADPPRWECKHPTNPRPFYGLESLVKHPKAQVMVHEAPKKAEAAALLFPRQAHVALLGGARQAQHMAVEPLEGRHVILVPDNDQAGREAMHALAGRLKPSKLRWLPTDKDLDGNPLPESWDIADAVAWTPQQALAWAKLYAKDYEAPAVGYPDGPSPVSPAPGASPSQDEPGRDLSASASTPAQGTSEPPALPATPTSAPPTHGLIRDAKGAIKACESSAVFLLNAAPQYADLHWDDFPYRTRIDGRDWTDHDDRDVLCWLQSAHQAPSFSLGQARNAIQTLAYARRCDSLQEFVLSTPEWDRVPRIEMAFVEAWGAEDTHFARAASRNFFIALHARAVKPGAQVDNLWVIEGPQGQLKSMSFRALGHEFHAEISASVGTADFLRELRGIWIAEMSELDSLRGREASTVKRLLSAPSDRFVDKYDRHAVAYPRRAVVVATTNEANYWQDSTGARRLIPIKAGTIRPDLIEANRLQWFSEAREYFNQGATWWEWPAETQEEQEARQIVDPWEDLLRAATQAPSWPVGWVSTAAITTDWLKLDPSQQGGNLGVRIGRVMRRMGYIPNRRGKLRERGWLPLER